MTKQEPWVVSQDFYDMIMALPDGADVSEFFDAEDPEWRVLSLKLVKHNDGEASLLAEYLVDLESAVEKDQ